MTWYIDKPKTLLKFSISFWLKELEIVQLEFANRQAGLYLPLTYNTIRTSNGHPRVGSEHPGLRHLAPFFITLVVLIIANIPFAVFVDSFWQGRIGRFPWCLTLSLMQFLPAFCFLVFAPLILMRSEPNYKRIVLRAIQELFWDGVACYDTSIVASPRLKIESSNVQRCHKLSKRALLVHYFIEYFVLINTDVLK